MDPQFQADLWGEVLPDPQWGENYVTPCYEQLIGAGYSLYRAEDSGFKTRNLGKYDVKGLFAELSGIAKGQPVQHPHWQAWLSGFFFNSGLHRIIWGCERLLLCFGWLPLKEGVSSGKEPRTIENIKKRAYCRLKELKQKGINQQLDNIEKTLKILPQIPDNDIKSVAVSANNYLSIIRIRVNVQKHWAQGAIYREVDKGVPGWWERLNPEEQFGYAACALKVACGVYRDVHGLYFERKILKGR